MKTHGRDSAESLAIKSIAEDRLSKIERPDAPYDLTDEQAKEWWAIVNRMPADWFPRETHPLLAELCRLTVRARKLAQMADAMEKTKKFDMEQYSKLIRDEMKVAGVMCSLATKMRISQQSAPQGKHSKKPVQLKRPWLREE